MLVFNTKISVSYLITSTAADVALALGRTDNARLWRRTSKLCAITPGGCSLGQAEADALLAGYDRLCRRYRALRLAGLEPAPMVEALFCLLAEALEGSLDLDDTNCICSWTQRMSDAEALERFLLEVARAYWGTGKDSGWMTKEMERLACLATDVAERDGSITRRAANDVSVGARADRLAVRLFDAANDIWCNNWSNEPWMQLVAIPPSDGVSRSSFDA